MYIYNLDKGGIELDTLSTKGCSSTSILGNDCDDLYCRASSGLTAKYFTCLVNDQISVILKMSYSQLILRASDLKMISFRIDWFDFLAVQGTLKSLL